MIIECSYCEANVDALVIAQNVDPGDDEIGLRFRVTLLSCPVCKNSLLAGQYENDSEDDSQEWKRPRRIWPPREKSFSLLIPAIARTSMVEARKCFKAAAYTACAVMCGRAIEGICEHFGTKSKNLMGGLVELRDKGIIEGRLYKWSEALRKSRNMGAHATGERIPKEAAEDLLLFTNAICEYVFVLSKQFEQFVKRETERNRKP